QEEADGNRNHRKNTRCNKCNSAPKRGGQQKSDQSFVGITGADFFQRHELFTDGFQICFVFAHGGGRWGDGWSFGLWYGDRHDWWTTLRIASAGTWVSRRRLWSAVSLFKFALVFRIDRDRRFAINRQFCINRNPLRRKAIVFIANQN